MGKKIKSINKRRDLLDDLLKLTANFDVTGAKEEWKMHLNIRKLLESLQKLETPFERPKLNRQERMEGLFEWAQKTLEIDVSKVDIALTNIGYGLKAAKDIQENEIILTVPENHFIQIPSSGSFANLIQKDRMLFMMPNVALAFYLLCEYNNKKSIWKPYFDSLPDEFDTVLYWSDDEIMSLKGSFAFGESIKLQRNIARQYSYITQILKNETDPLLPSDTSVTYNQYRWAVSVVMTRQNSLNKTVMNTVLVPIWDNCNHETSPSAKTDYVLADGGQTITCPYTECSATRYIKCGNEITINYGKRRILLDFLLHCGFVPSDIDPLINCIRIRLGISSSEKLYKKRLQLLSLFGLDSSGVHEISSQLSDKSLLYVFLRVFHMDQDMLDHWLQSDDRILLKELTGAPAGDDIEKRSWLLLKNRVELILASYGSTDEDDEKTLVSDCSNRLKFAARLKISERSILRKIAADFCHEPKILIENCV